LEKEKENQILIKIRSHDHLQAPLAGWLLASAASPFLKK
jgi:hypothetical protein